MLKKCVKKMRYRYLCQKEFMQNVFARAKFRLRASFKHVQQRPIHIVFICHMPALWSMFESVYNAAAEKPDFVVTVVALPYKHPTLPDGQYKDEGTYEYLIEKKINAIRGYDKEKEEWLNPESLKPDYVFYQVPYQIFTDSWSVERLSKLARVCYLTYYGTCLFRGEVEKIVHPASFFKFVNMFFVDNMDSKKNFEEMFNREKWFNPEGILLTGHPKMDCLLSKLNTKKASWKIWKRGEQKNIKRILWTPRWYTSEGTCHFFDYKDFFVDFCENNRNIDFVLRPHPLCLQNFLKTGELSASDLEQMEDKYEKSTNMSLDRSSDYFDTFLTSDVLVSDISSMLLEYFLTGKPIIYTHRVDGFNEFGKKLSEGFYFANNFDELKTTVEMLISGNDPLRKTREALIDLLLYMPDGGAGLMITNNLQADFNSCSLISRIQKSS